MTFTFTALLCLGMYNDNPSLTALPSPVVTSGGNMTLQCVSGNGYDKFVLTKEDEKFSSSLDSQYIGNGYQATFSVGSVTPVHSGTFRCYGYLKNTTQLWSVPSDPLKIHISACALSQSLTPGERMYLKALIGVSVAFLLFLFILIFLLLRRKHQGKFRKDDASVEDMKPQDGVELHSSRPPGDDPQGETYAQVKDSRLRRAEAVLP
ncbi:Lilr4b [Phodopus roborovskii]|uniref:Lilr4b protein n=1 Tax=Phodopus roborovskii TaxID=109678 RepID=A0AAV0ACE2_PHORO|nr:Lilr4b [Phodopus roborovskii]